MNLAKSSVYMFCSFALTPYQMHQSEQLTGTR